MSQVNAPFSKEESRVLRSRTEIQFAVLKAILSAIRGTRGSLFQKKNDDTADVNYNLVALDCERPVGSSH